MRRVLTILLILTGFTASLPAENVVYDNQVKSLEATVNGQWQALFPVMRMGQQDALTIGFDELSHDYHRYVYHIEHCEDNWEPSADIFESDYLEGFNDIPVEDYQNSINTVIPYTHYQLTIPNSQCQLKLSGNYRLYIYDEEDGNKTVASVEFMVVEPLTDITLEVTTNTDIGLNSEYQQLTMSLHYKGLSVTNAEEQIHMVVMQNGCKESARSNVVPSHATGNGLVWEHQRQLIFPAGNEYRKFEILDTSHPTMGIEEIRWDGQRFNAYPFADKPASHYLYDEDANGAFVIRNSDYQESHTTSDYVYVHYRLYMPFLPEGDVLVDGKWATDNDSTHYRMEYDGQEGAYHVTVLQKLGYYNYRYLLRGADGALTPLPSQGNFYQTENEYEALVYYKGTGDRTWRLVGCQSVSVR